uniref:Uncharacterized protein n=1 Tax=viral metagenome TaxID=1070528 RepID=A0A6M3J464_9ZZZZ
MSKLSPSMQRFVLAIGLIIVFLVVLLAIVWGGFSSDIAYSVTGTVLTLLVLVVQFYFRKKGEDVQQITIGRTSTGQPVYVAPTLNPTNGNGIPSGTVTVNDGIVEILPEATPNLPSGGIPATPAKITQPVGSGVKPTMNLDKYTDNDLPSDYDELVGEWIGRQVTNPPVVPEVHEPKTGLPFEKRNAQFDEAYKAVSAQADKAFDKAKDLDPIATKMACDLKIRTALYNAYMEAKERWLLLGWGLVAWKYPR